MQKIQKKNLACPTSGECSISQNINNADNIPESDRYKFVDDQIILEPVKLMNAGISAHNFKLNKMELLQSQAPVDQELSGSSASARHGTLDIIHQTWDIGI